jgi:hypothetical protein
LYTIVALRIVQENKERSSSKPNENPEEKKRSDEPVTACTVRQCTQSRSSKQNTCLFIANCKTKGKNTITRETKSLKIGFQETREG